MRFFVDQDVDVDVATALRALGHDAWTATAAGLGVAGDDDLTAYAMDKNAVLITHDREFSVRRARNVIGRHIWLDCLEIDAAEVLTQHLSLVLPVLIHREHVGEAVHSWFFPKMTSAVSTRSSAR